MDTEPWIGQRFIEILAMIAAVKGYRIKIVMPEWVSVERRKEGLLVGMSAGAILDVALKKARELGTNKCVVAVLPDSGDKYLSTPLFE